MKKNLLLEIYSEEIPSLQQEIAVNNLCKNIKNALYKNKFYNSRCACFFTPRRISIYLNRIDRKTKNSIKIVRGPKIFSLKESIEGFKKKFHIKSRNLYVRNGYYYYNLTVKLKPVVIILKDVIEDVLENFSWIKSMKWGNMKTKWIRPILSILCLFDNKILPINFGHLTAANKTFCNWMVDFKSYQVISFIDYYKLLSNGNIILKQQKRINIIRNKISSLTKSFNLLNDNCLLKEVANLIEYPVITIGKINKKFMSLPHKIIVYTLKYHQKYLMLKDDDNNLLPKFVIIINYNTQDKLKTVILGNEKVLESRLKDIKFFINEDRKKSLRSKLYQLKNVTYHNKIGSYIEKLIVMKKIVENLSIQFNFNIKKSLDSLNIIKNDLLTKTVQELPFLQGVIGYYYALLDNEDRDVALTVKDHYMPQGPTDIVPNNNLSIIIALSDKITSLNLLFKIGIRSSGSKDPFALRRCAIGIIRIICINNLNISIKHFILYDVFKFISIRLKNIKNSRIKINSNFLLYITEFIDL